MADYVILTDSTCDLTAEMAEEFNLEVVRLHVLLNGHDYEHWLDARELSFKDLYDSMRNKELPTTSQVNSDAFLKAMEPILQSGKDILYVGFSGPMSGTLNNGRIAAEELLEKYPDRKIEIVDSLAATMGEGLLVYIAVKNKEKGMSIIENKENCESCVPHLTHCFTVDDLMHICRGGRATKSAALIGSVLGIKPILVVNDEGLIEPFMKVRGKKAALKKIACLVNENLASRDLPIFVGHGDCLEEAEEFAKMLKEVTGVDNIYINTIGAVCGCHGGPGLLGAFYYGKKR